MMKRYPNNPILTRNDIPPIPPGLVDVTSVFNPGAIFFQNKIWLILRVQNRGRETSFVTAQSDDGIHFKISNNSVNLTGIELLSDTVYHCYDARPTLIGDTIYIMFAMDMDNGCSLGLARTSDMLSFEFLGIASTGDIRNGVLFPEKFNGKYLRLDRPNDFKLEGGPVTGSTICLSESNDLLHWTRTAPIISGRFHYWDELIGMGPSPIKTRHGWLCIYHGVATHFGSANIYQAGVFLLDLQDPTKLIARGHYNILEPREPYELMGQVPNVVFPSGAIVKDVDNEGFARESSEVFVYYGATDTCVGLATTTISQLLTHCSG